jgi:hypothetical protein
MSTTRYGACQRGTAEYSSTQQIRSSSTAPNSCWPTWAARGRAKWFVSGDHPEPTEFVKSVIEGFGFVPVYLGGLATGGRLQQAGGPLAGRDLVDFGSL